MCFNLNSAAVPLLAAEACAAKPPISRQTARLRYRQIHSTVLSPTRPFWLGFDNLQVADDSGVNGDIGLLTELVIWYQLSGVSHCSHTCIANESCTEKREHKGDARNMLQSVRRACAPRMIASILKKASQPDQVSHVVRKSSEFLRAETVRLAGNWGVLRRPREVNCDCPTATISRSQVL